LLRDGGVGLLLVGIVGTMVGVWAVGATRGIPVCERRRLRDRCVSLTIAGQFLA